jgi:hypothetical protein
MLYLSVKAGSVKNQADIPSIQFGMITAFLFVNFLKIPAYKSLSNGPLRVL